MDNFTTYTGENVDEFIRNYREALKAQRDSAVKQLDQQRRNDYTKIMSGANKMGMMYSNFPSRTKTQYLTSTYNPNLVKVQNTYQSALDSLRSNAVNLWNKVKSYEEATKDLNDDII